MTQHHPERIDRVIDARTERPRYFRVVAAVNRDDVALTVAVDLYAVDGAQARALAREAAERDTGITAGDWTVERTELRS